MTGGARRFGRRCRHDFEVAAHSHAPEQQQAMPRQQQSAEQPREKPETAQRGAEQPRR